jgi:serine/threonine protein kinase
LIDFSPGKIEKQQALPKFLEMIEKTSHPNLLNLCGKSQILKQINTLVFKTDSPDHISTWKQFCKTPMSLFHTLSLFRQLTSAVAHLNKHGIVHRDVHPTRLHVRNGILKFNIIGLPYNFKKLMKSNNYSGHVSYSAPELITDG